MDWLPQTKLHPPLLQDDLIPREQLLQTLHAALLSHPLTLLSAPAGYGKTTLLSKWVETLERSTFNACWLTLDEEDDDPISFLTAFAAALGRLNPACGVTALSLLRSPPETTVRDIVVDAANPGLVYVATHDSGVYVSHDSGATWSALNDGLLIRAAFDLALSADGSVLYLATEGGGVFRLGTPAEAAVLSAEEELMPTTVPEDAAEPSAPEPAQKSPTSEEGGGGLPCLGGALPLAAVGLVWRRRRK